MQAGKMRRKLTLLRSNRTPAGKAQPYRPGTSLDQTSPLRPLVPVAERLVFWKPRGGRSAVDASGRPLPLSEDDLNRVITAQSLGLTKGTCATYGTALLYYHEFCDTRHIAEESRTPISQPLLETFLASLVGSFSRSVADNAHAALKAWHRIHGIEWNIADGTTNLIMRAIHIEAPVRREARRPMLVNTLERIRHILDLSTPRDIAFFACLTTTFWATARLGKFVIPSIAAYNPSVHVKPSNVSIKRDASGRHQVHNFRLPRTKVSDAGEDVMWAAQLGDADPFLAFELHLQKNAPPNDGPLFAYRDGRGHTPTTRDRFLRRLSQVCTTLKIPDMHGHSLRIGGTLELLLRGIPFEAVKVKGRWQGESFQKYLRKHSAVLAPYLQADRRVDPEVLRQVQLPAVR